MRILSTALVLTALHWHAVSAETLELHIDADYAISTDAAQSIETGVRSALSEVGGQIAGYDIEIVRNDHRGSVRRSRRTMENYLENDRAIAIIGGLHSPPYLAHREFINQNAILTLLPWSAAGAITRSLPGDENWIFRVSVDDLKTGPFLVDEATVGGGCNRVGLVLVDTPWGRGNFQTLTAALGALGKVAVFSQFFDPGISHANAAILAEDFAASSADCAIILANWDNGSEVVLAMHERALGVRIFSHWGIMGGAFAERVPHDIRTAMDLRVLQTCGLDRETSGSDILSTALQATGQGYTSLADVQASAGFVHAYDLTRIFIAAVEQASTTPEWQGDIVAKRRAVHDALEDINIAVEGILKTYTTPFQPPSSGNIDAHEALGIADLCMAQFNASGTLALIQ